MNSFTVAEATEKLYQLLDEVSESHEPVHIRGERSKAVLVSEDDWRSIQETLHLLSIPGMRESIVEGIKTPLEECDEGLSW